VDVTDLPRWARIAIWTLGAVCLGLTILVSATSGWITDWFLDRIGFWRLVAGCVVGTGIFIWIGSRLDDD
jgi:hypothetical protein